MTRTKSIALWAVVAVIAAVMATTAVAQPPGGGQRRGGGPPGGGGRGPGGGSRVSISDLLRIEKVRADAKITEEDQKKLADLAAKRREGMRERFAGFREMSEEDRRTAIQKLGEERNKELASALGKEKIARLNQIRLQVLGFRALGDSTVIENLGISEDQGATLSKINVDLNEKRREVFAGGRPTGGQDVSREQRMAQFQEGMKKIQKLQADALKEAVDNVFNADQQAKWKTMIGKKFEISLQDRMQGRGRGMQGRGGGPRGGGQGRPGGRPGGGQQRGGGREQ